MRKDPHIRGALLWSMVLISFLSVGFMGYFWISYEYHRFHEETRRLKEDDLSRRKESIRQEVERVIAYVQYRRDTTETRLKASIRERVAEAVALAENLYDALQGSHDEAEIRVLIREALRRIQFNEGRGYYFVYDMTGRNILLPFSPELEGENLWNLQDSRGLYTIRRFVRMLEKDGEGFLRWHWYKPGEEAEMSEKIGYARYVERLGWWIGTGEYIEDFEKDIQAETLEWINKIRFGKDGYIFVTDFEGLSLAHYKPENVGINRWDLADADGVKVYQELIRISQQENGGFLGYIGTIRPSTGKPAPKIGYARSVPDWEWMIGAGIYVDDIEAMLAGKRQELRAEVLRHIYRIAFLLAGLLLGILLFARFLSGKIMKNFASFSDFFSRAARSAIRIDAGSLYFAEFRQLAHAANQMIDERNRVQQALIEKEERLNRARKMEALGLLAGGVAHDLNNVLAGTVSYPDLILMDLPAESPLRKPLMTIRESGIKAAAIVEDLLTLARRGVTTRQVVHLNDMIREYMASPEYAKLLSFHTGVRVETDLDEDLLHIKGSPVHLKKTVMNLVSNAAEAQPAGGLIRITTENRYVDQSIGAYETIREGEFVLLKISDRGSGISAQDLRRIFEPFYTKKVMGRSGTGLGMAVVWGTIQDHDGYINVESVEGGGTIFELYFPVTREAPENREIISRDQYTGAGQSILVVDDVDTQRELARSMLERLGYRVRTVSGGEAAVAFLQKTPVDLIILDMIMDPGIDGLETYRRILSVRPGQRAVIASGYAETGRVREALRLGAGPYLKKPYTIEQLGIAVRTAFSAVCEAELAAGSVEN